MHADAQPTPTAANDIWTIGHSTLPITVFIARLEQQGIRTVADVRRFAGSRRNPQFGSGPLADALADAGIGYLPLPELGGRRTMRVDSPNTAWRNEAFRGYADWMARAEYRAAFDALTAVARVSRTALMCAEVLWWRCHRSMIADELALRGWHVHHILGDDGVAEHAFRVPARLIDGHADYTSAQGTLL